MSTTHCGCDACERDDALLQHHNPAGLDAVDYRIGTWAHFLGRMKGWISRQALPPDQPSSQVRPLAQLSTRAQDDPTLALMDAWASVLDVLSFYQERIANEGWLRTATERRSVLELARSIGYELDPGVAASTWLAFTLLETPKSPSQVTLAQGLQVQSVPGPGELPQAFETVAEIVARPQHNALRPAQREPHPLVLGEDTLYLQGLSTGLRKGDRIIVVGNERLSDHGSEVWELRTVVEVELDKEAAITKVTVDRGLGGTSRVDHELAAFFHWRDRGSPPGDDWQDWFDSVAPVPEDEPRIYAFSKRASAFGHSAPDPRVFDLDCRKQLLEDELLEADWSWKGLQLQEDDLPVVHLVGEHPDVVPGSWIAMEAPTGFEVYQVLTSEPSARTDFSLSLKTTRLTLDTDEHLADFDPREVSIQVVSRELFAATRPLLDPVEGGEIVLSEAVPPLERGRTVLISGPPAGSAADAAHVVEVATVAEATTAERYGAPRTVLTLESPLEGRFDRARTTILANVAPATHGQTISAEVLGSGDGSARFQTFALRQAPVTIVSSAAGSQSTLTLRVGGVAWEAVDSTWQRGADEAVYVSRVGDDGVTSVTFGDGHQGARLPTGSENITAHYRVGLGSAGAVDADTLTILKNRPKGLKSVTNPLAAKGAADPETLADARINAPVTVLTLDRLVSESDYEDFARATAGIGKAQAVRLWDGRRWWVHLTLATAEGAELLPTDALYQSLVADIQARRDPVQRVLFDTFTPPAFRLRGTLRVDPACVPEEVLEAVHSALRAAFSFEARAFGQPVTGAEILAVCHRVDGVVAVDLDALWRDGEEVPDEASTSPASWVLPAHKARWEGGVEQAELLLLHPDEEAIALEVRP